MVTTAIPDTARPDTGAPDTVMPEAKPAQIIPPLAIVPEPERPIVAPAPPDSEPWPDLERPHGWPLLGELRLNLSALGIDHHAPDFGERFCRMTSDNEPWQMEYSAEGELIIMPLPAQESARDEIETGSDLTMWRRDNGGMSYGANIGFHLPSGAVRAPDAAWTSQERHDRLTPQERRGTINGAPDFLVEIRSRSDRLPPFLAKMAEWMAAGAKLGWGIDPRNRRAYIYRAGQSEPEILENPETLSGEDVLPGFVFAVGRLIFDRYVEE